ncbi:winged helix-turn-helix domain-containing protein [Fodinicola feengrottensis]|uniref:Winged helix-turn-helix domain-containing protein n=1 Tax=Fodinicola feengrottensis TaxID=435914 RepID=A0ABN2G8J6_9ACTN
MAFRRWCGATQLSGAAKQLLLLAPAQGYSPDFLTPAEGAAGLDAGLDAVLTTPRARLRTEMGKLGAGHRLGPWARDVADGRSPAMQNLSVAIREFHRGVLEPRWSYITSRVNSDRARRTEALATDGVGSLLTGLHPSLRWQAPHLELAGQHVNGDLRLQGRGLRLIPSFFCRGVPTVLEDADLAPVLVYPIDGGSSWLAPHSVRPDPEDHAPLIALLGPTRAKVLVAAAAGCTTTELGQRAAISPASASYHATVLREAGLLTTRRNGMSVQHDLTALGSALLDGQLTL